MKNNPFPKIFISQKHALSIDKFKEIDYFTVEHFNLPIELMMEHAGLHLARLISNFSNKNSIIQIGIGNGNNGGGGLVAARRLAAWGYKVYLDIPFDINKELPESQLKRALKYGAKIQSMDHCDIWVDAYLGFSQKPPLSFALLNAIHKANRSEAIKISLDIPTGFFDNKSINYFDPDHIITLAAPKKLLYSEKLKSKIYIADIGIPKEVYEKFGFKIELPFDLNGIIQLEIG